MLTISCVYYWVNRRLCILPRKTPENHRIVMTSLITSDTTDYVIADVGKVTLMCIESIFMTEPTLDGLIIIHDIELATFSHFLKAAWNMPRKLRPYFQVSAPRATRSGALSNPLNS